MNLNSFPSRWDFNQLVPVHQCTTSNRWIIYMRAGLTVFFYNQWVGVFSCHCFLYVINFVHSTVMTSPYLKEIVKTYKKIQIVKWFKGNIYVIWDCLYCQLKATSFYSWFDLKICNIWGEKTMDILRDHLAVVGAKSMNCMRMQWWYSIRYKYRGLCCLYYTT